MEEGEVGVKASQNLIRAAFSKSQNRTGRSDRSDFKNEIRELSSMCVVNTYSYIYIAAFAFNFSVIISYN